MVDDGDSRTSAGGAVVMTGMLASVNSLEEALVVAPLNVDIIDLKQPEQGALGALPTQTVARIVACLSPQVIVSATVGDLPMQADLLFKAVSEMAETGVDYVKIGFFPGGNWQACIDRLAEISQQGQALIAVLFADTSVDFAVIDALQHAGFRGVMLDTMDKSNGSLTQLMSEAKLLGFVETAHAAGLLTGLAGSLQLADLDELLPLKADYLGFRGALCQQHNRTEGLNVQQIAEIRRWIVDFKA